MSFTELDGSVLETYSDEYVICPYCGYNHDVSDFLCDNILDGEIDCSNCEKDFKLSSEVSIHFETEEIQVTKNDKE